MIQLRPVDFMQIQHWFVDYQKKSKNFELPPEEAQMLGIYRGSELIGYFITLTYQDGTVEINQGYLKKEARHKNLSKIAMSLLEQLVKQNGYRKITLGTNRAVGSYIRFMRSMGFGIERAIFSKEVK